ncbi:energy transducer TonB [Flavimarina sp. Hel_I_48]|uniref:energy transducer TonB n=1 Tax=Flavimarina sp. Hel_I_48 TaxID=1392488 RepID=UPI0004DF3C9A|nr:energy transducer TonB [Flavimarina sp. Hel_I_48]
MKKLLVLLFLTFTATTFAQDGVSVNGGTMVIKDIAPVWPGCDGSIAKKKACFKQKLAQHIGKNFRFPEGYTPGSVKEKVVVSFVINEKGAPEILEVKGGTAALQNEAKRNILSIPHMTPGQANGKPKAIKYKVPFTF